MFDAVIGAAPLVPQAWRDPRSETASTFVLSAVVGLGVLLPIRRVEFSLCVYPAYYLVVNASSAKVILNLDQELRALLIGKAARDQTRPRW